LIKNYIEDRLRNFYDIILNELFQQKTEATEDETRKRLDKEIIDLMKVNKRIKYDATKNAILNSLKTNLSKRLDNIEFDVSKPYTVCFKNKAFDIRTGEEIEVHKLDYITFSTGYDYIEPTKEDMHEIGDIIDSIFPNPEIKKTYLSTLWTGLSGVRQEKFFIANGGGRNGKGLINELMLKTLGEDYSYTGHITTLTKELKSGPNPEMAGLDKKRFVKFEEPNDTDQLNLGNIKKITGEGYLNARMCNSNNTKCLLHLTAIFECNQLSKLNGKIDASIVDRFVNIYFSSYFTNDEEELKTNSHAKPINLKYKMLEWQEKIRCAFFKYIVEEAEKTLYIAEEVKAKTREYLLENDDIFLWFNETYQKAEGGFITLKQVRQQHKDSGAFYSMNRADQSKLKTEKAFNEMIISNIELRKYFKERYKDIRTVLIGWKLKPTEIYLYDDNQ